jgi:hypothetical protein
VANERGRPVETLLNDDPELRVSARPGATLDEVAASLDAILPR